MKILDRLFPIQNIYAHCDIPCGIYDPHNAQMGAHTVLQMTRGLSDLPKEDTIGREHQVTRLTRVKEQHGALVEEELGTLENDYFKSEHFEKFPNLKPLFEETVKLSIKTRQNIDLEAAENLLENTLQIAEIFFQTKGVEPIRVASVYPTKGEIVVHK